MIARGIGYAKKPDVSVEDQRNRFDTPQTVTEIETHNLRYEAVCPSA